MTSKETNNAEHEHMNICPSPIIVNKLNDKDVMTGKAVL